MQKVWNSVHMVEDKGRGFFYYLKKVFQKNSESQINILPLQKI